MDFWNRKKVANLQRENERLKGINSRLKAEIVDLAKQTAGDGICGRYCKECIYGFKSDSIYLISWGCLRNCKCNNFIPKSIGDMK